MQTQERHVADLVASLPTSRMKAVALAEQPVSVIPSLGEMPMTNETLAREQPHEAATC
jgi:hypothetical protein